MRILFLSRWNPFPANNGSKLRVYNLLKGLAAQHELSLLSFTDQSDTEIASPEIQSLCSEIQFVHWREFNSNSWRAKFGFVSPTPRFLLDTYSSPMASLIEKTVSLKSYDLVVASELSMASYYKCFAGLPALFEDLELGPFYPGAFNGDIRKTLRGHLTWLKLRKYLSVILNTFRSCTVVSPVDMHLFNISFPEHKKKISVIPNCINFDDYLKSDVQPINPQMIFTGSFRFNANYEAMQWFVGKVFPKILAQVPDARLLITGDHAGLPLPPAPNVTLTGYVPDIKSLMTSSWISVAPLRSGGGTRLKILESMAVGTPVIATSKGAEGLDAVPGEHLLIADTPEAFADQVIRILNDRNARDRLSVNGKNMVKEKYNWETMMPRFLQLVQSVADDRN